MEHFTTRLGYSGASLGWSSCQSSPVGPHPALWQPCCCPIIPVEISLRSQTSLIRWAGRGGPEHRNKIGKTRCSIFDRSDTPLNVDLGAVEAKGFEEAVQTYQVLRACEPMRRALRPAARTPLRRCSDVGPAKGVANVTRCRMESKSRTQGRASFIEIVD